MVSLIAGCLGSLLLIKSSFNFWKPWVLMQKISSRYRNHRKGSSSLFRKILFSNPALNKLEYGEANLVPIANLFFDGTLTPHSQNNYS